MHDRIPSFASCKGKREHAHLQKLYKNFLLKILFSYVIKEKKFYCSNSKKRLKVKCEERKSIMQNRLHLSHIAIRMHTHIYIFEHMQLKCFFSFMNISAVQTHLFSCTHTRTRI